MERVQFDKLEIAEQLQYINQNLKTSTLTNICEEIGIGRTTIRDRFYKESYIFDKYLKQYIKDSEYKHNTSVLQVAATKLPPGEYKRNTSIFNSKDAQNKILDILEKHDNIHEMLEWFNKQKNVIEVDLNELKIDNANLQGEIKVTTVRLYNDVWEQFRTFMGEYSEFKSMDLISMALLEYMHKYKK